MALTISVITPSLNQGRFIDRTIRSVLSQNVEDLEYFVVDGGSRDETLEILKRYTGRLKWISEGDNGQADGVNKGIRATRGDIIGWLNSDDIYYPGALSFVLSFFEEHPEVDVVYGDADHINIDDTLMEPYCTEDWDFERLKKICFLCQPAVFFRRRITETAGLLDARLQYCMDYEYWLRLGAITPFKRLNRNLAGSRMYEENKTLGSRVPVHREINNMFRSRLGYVPLKWIYAYAHVVADQKGYDRLDPAENFRYVCLLVWTGLKSCFHWRRGLSVRSIKTMSGWIGGALKNMGLLLIHRKEVKK